MFSVKIQALTAVVPFYDRPTATAGGAIETWSSDLSLTGSVWFVNNQAIAGNGGEVLLELSSVQATNSLRKAFRGNMLDSFRELQPGTTWSKQNICRSGPFG